MLVKYPDCDVKQTPNRRLEVSQISWLWLKTNAKQTSKEQLNIPVDELNQFLWPLTRPWPTYPWDCRLCQRAVCWGSPGRRTYTLSGSNASSSSPEILTSSCNGYRNQRRSRVWRKFYELRTTELRRSTSLHFCTIGFWVGEATDGAIVHCQRCNGFTVRHRCC